MRYESPIHEKGPNRFTFLPRREAFSVLILPFSTHIYYELVFKHPSSPILHYSREHSERCKSALQPSRTGWKLAANEVTIMRVFNSNLLFTRTHLNGRSWYVHKRAIKWLKRVTSKQCLIYYLGGREGKFRTTPVRFWWYRNGRDRNANILQAGKFGLVCMVNAVWKGSIELS